MGNAISLTYGWRCSWKVRTYPDDLAIGPIDLVYRACVTSGDEIVPIGILVDTINVEVVPSIRTVVA